MQRHIPHAPSPEEVFNAKQASFPLFVADVDLRSLREASVANRMVMFDRPQELTLVDDLAIPPLETLFSQIVKKRSEAIGTQSKPGNSGGNIDYRDNKTGNNNDSSSSDQIEISAVNKLFECAYSFAPVHAKLMKRANREFNQAIESHPVVGEPVSNADIYKTSESLFLRLFDFGNPDENLKVIKAIEEVWQKSNIAHIDKHRLLTQITNIIDGRQGCRMQDIKTRMSLANNLLRELAFGKQESKEPQSKVGLSALIEANPVRAVEDIANYVLG